MILDFGLVIGTKVTDGLIAKLSIVEEEADESIYWMDLLVESGLLLPDRTRALRQEADELVAMTVTSIKTLRKRNHSSQL